MQSVKQSNEQAHRDLDMVLGDQSAEKKFEDIREEFFKNHKENIGLGKYHKLDLERIRRDNDWLKAFYKYSEQDETRTVNMLDEVLTWRNEFGANDLLVSGKPPVAEEMFKKGGLFYRNEDINCTPMLHFVVKTHKKDNYPQLQVFKFISYFFEKNYRFNLDDPIVLIFDMSDAGYSNLDMDMIKFVVTCLKTYYPGLIDYMIVYQMPFIFNAAWKIIKNWLPANAVNLIKFCDKKSIKEYVQPSQLFTHMGGTDNFKYVFDPCMFIIKKDQSQTEEPIIPVDSLRRTSTKILASEAPQLKLEQISPVIVTDNDKNLMAEPEPSIIMDDTQINNQHVNKTTDESIIPTSKTNGTIINKIYDATNSNDQTVENILTTPLLTISPGDELLFNVTDCKQDITQFIKLTNTSDGYLAYKIKITSPDKFRVKPGTGIIPTAANAQIMINFLKEFHNSVNNHRDKFLILWTPIDKKLQASDLNEFWKQAVTNKKNINEHKVKCLIKRPSDAKSKSPNSVTSDTTNNEKHLPISPSVTSVNNYFSPRENSSQNLDTISKIGKKKSTATLASVSSALPEIQITPTSANNPSVKSKPKTKLEKLEIQTMVHTKDENLLMEQNRKQNNINAAALSDSPDHKIDKLQKNIDTLVDNQQRLGRQYSQIIYLIYFLVMLNVIQLIFQSNLFTQIVEPYFDHLLFDHSPK